MKKLVFIIFLLGISFSVFSQNDSIVKPKSETSNINVYGGYGIGTIYVFTKKVKHDYTLPYDISEFTPVSSCGSFIIGFDANVSKIVSIGFDFSYIPLNYTGKMSDSVHTTMNYKDNVLSGMIKLQLNYINKPMVRAYSGLSLGVSYIFSSVTDNKNISLSTKTIRPAGQFTLMGIRVGKKLGGFGEFGFGTNGVVVVGVNYKF